MGPESADQHTAAAAKAQALNSRLGECPTSMFHQPQAAGVAGSAIADGHSPLALERWINSAESMACLSFRSSLLRLSTKPMSVVSINSEGVA